VKQTQSLSIDGSNSLEETENALVNYSQEQERRDRLQEPCRDQTALELSRSFTRPPWGLLPARCPAQLYGNEDLLAQSQNSVATNLIALYKALGGGWESFPNNKRLRYTSQLWTARSDPVLIDMDLQEGFVDLWTKWLMAGCSEVHTTCSERCFHIPRVSEDRMAAAGQC